MKSVSVHVNTCTLNKRYCNTTNSLPTTKSRLIVLPIV